MFHSVKVTIQALLLIGLISSMGTGVSRAGEEPVFRDETKGTLNVVGTYPLGDKFHDQIIFYFNEPLKIEGEVKDKPMTFSPPLEGKFEIGDSYIAFHAKSPLPNQIYLVTLNELLTSKDGKPLNSKQLNFSFSTQIQSVPVLPVSPPPPLTVNNAAFRKIDGNEHVIDIYFTEAVDSQELSTHAKIQNANNQEDIPYDLLTSGQTNNHRLRFYLDENTQNIRLIIRNGLESANHRILSGDYNNSYQLQTAAFSLQNTWWRQDGRDGMALQVNTTHPLSTVTNAEELAKYIEVTPTLPNMRVQFSEWSGNAFVVYGDWQGETPYQLKIKAGLRFAESATLPNDWIENLTTERIEPFIGYGYPGKFYFPRRTGIALPLETRNVSQVELTLYRLFPNNLVASLRDMDNDLGNYTFNESWCEKLSSTKIPISGASHTLIKTNLDIDKILPQDRRGVFCISSSNGEYRTENKIVLNTDMGVLSHWKNDELVVFAHDLFSLAPQENATVRVYSSKAQFMAEGQTDSQGMYHFTNLSSQTGAPFTIVVEQGDDFTFLELENRPHNSPQVQPGMPLYNSKGYDAFIYADRDLYRPGETIHLRWIVRTNFGDALSSVPLLMSVLKPNGKTLLSRPTTLSSLGTGTMDLNTQQAYPTGNYTVQLSVPGESSPIGYYTFKLEDFVPHRMKAEVVLAEDRWLPEQDYTITVNAKHLFGTPAVDRKAQTRVIFKRGQFKPQDWEEFTFDNDSKYIPETVSLGDAITDASGSASFNFSYSPTPEVTFPLQAVVLGDVLELGGRAVTGKATSTFLPSDILLGIAASPNPAGKGVNVYAAAISNDGSPADLPQVQITLEREVWNYYVRRYYSYNEPNWTKAYQVVETRTVDLANGRGSTLFETGDYGSYRVRVHSDATQQFSTLSFYCYWDQCAIGQAAEPGLIKLALDKEEYKPGEAAIVRIESPFDGQGIVVVQGETIQDMIPVKIEKGSGLVRIPIDADDYPNIWAEVTVVHEVKSDRPQVYPFSSFSMINLKVNRPDRKLVVTFPTLPEEIPPESTSTFAINVVDQEGLPVQAELTLAAVDEGIHGITNYQSPDPYAYLSRSRQPDFRRAHYYDRVVYDFEKMNPGGDMEEGLGNAVTQPLRNWIKPVALWSGAVTTDAEGHASVTMQIPDYTGQLRLVAVANSMKAVGADSQIVYVRKPFMMEISLPRFVLPDDTMQSRIVIYNHTDAPAKAQLRWNANGTLREVTGEIGLDVPAQGETNYAASFVAQPLIGQGTVRWSAAIVDASGNILDTLAEEAPLPVLPPAAYQSLHKLLVLQPGQGAVLGEEDFLPDPRNKMEVTVTGNPVWRIKDALAYNIQYPYGCIEQTLSKLLPLYLLRKNQELVESTLKDSRIDHFIRAGIDRLFAMQTPNGGLAMWPGGMDPYPYGSVYGLHFLTLVKKEREFELPQGSFESLQSYVRNLAMNWSSDSESDLYLRAYALYTLAMDGDLSAIQQIQRFDQIAIPRTSRYLLAAALAMNTQDTERVQYYLTKAPSFSYTIRELDRTLNSDIRNAAVELLALQQIQGNESQKVELANHLISFLESHRYGTTQETAFIVTALGNYLSNLAENTGMIAAEIHSPTETLNFTGTQTYQSRYSGPDAIYSVTNTGEVPLYIVRTGYGIPKETPKAAVNKGGLKVTRNFYAGKSEHKGAFQQGDLFVVDVTLQADLDLKNIVVSDLLPAGFEVENPRLDPDAAPDSNFKGTTMPSNLEIRDDRVVLAFDQLERKEHHYYYIVRAVTPGKFQYPPIHAECMYDPSIYSTSMPTTMEVK